MEEITIEKINLINSLCLKNGERNIILSIDRLLSALSNQYQPYDSNEKIIASLYKALILDHAFENGNKRTAVITLAYLASYINKEIKINDENLCSLTYRIADDGGSLIEVDYLAEILFIDSKDSSQQQLEIFTKSFCKNHRWLIDKLGE